MSKCVPTHNAEWGRLQVIRHDGSKTEKLRKNAESYWKGLRKTAKHVAIEQKISNFLYFVSSASFPLINRSPGSSPRFDGLINDEMQG